MPEFQTPDEVGSEKPRLAPTMEGSTPGTPLYDYFADKLPACLSKERYEHGLSCFGFARLILQDLGGSVAARIYGLRRVGHDLDEAISHAFVVPVNAEPTAPAYNNTGEIQNADCPLSNAEVIQEGEDITDEILASPWDEL